MTAPSSLDLRVCSRTTFNTVFASHLEDVNIFEPISRMVGAIKIGPRAQTLLT
jgi:hypothetical protein